MLINSQYFFMEWNSHEFYPLITCVRTGVWTSAHQEQWMITQQAQNNMFVREWVFQENNLAN